MKIGNKFNKKTGYKFTGEIRAIFTNTKGEIRIVGELIGDNGNGMLHIFSPEQINIEE